MKRYVVLMLILPCIGSAASDGFQKGENLLQSFPLPEFEWVQYQKQSDEMLRVLWQANDSKDSSMTTISYKSPNKDVKAYREFDRKLGHNSCAKHSTRDLDDSQQNGYPTYLWVSECRLKDGSIQYVLQKGISGRDSFYLLKRVWRYEPSEDSLNTWETYFKKIELCDTRSKESPCPKGFSRVETGGT